MELKLLNEIDEQWWEGIMKERVKGNNPINLNKMFSILDAVSVPLYYMDIKGVYTNCNEKFLEYMSINRDQIIGKTIFDIAPKDIAEIYYQKDLELFANPGEQIYDLKLSNAIGEIKEATFHKTTIADDNGVITGLIGTFIDTTREKQAETAMQESESKFMKLAETTALAILIYQDDRIVYANKSTTEITEYDEEELIGMLFWDLVHPDDLERVKEAGAKRQLGKETIPRYEFKIVTKTGKIKCVDLSGTTILYNGKNAGIISVNDVTDRVNILEKVRESEERAKFLANVTFEGIVIHKNGKIIDVNESFQKITGYGKKEAIGKNLLDYVVLAKDKIKIMTKIVQQKAAPYTITAQRKNGERFIAELEACNIKYNGKMVRIAAIRDVTERSQMEKALEQSQERLEMALDGASIGLWDMDYVTGKVYRSDNWATMLGYKPEEIHNDEDFWEWLLHPDDKERVKQESRKVQKNRERYIRTEYRLRCKDGSYKWILSWGQYAEYSKNGVALRSVGVHIDIDKRKKAEEEIQNLLKSKEILLKEVHHRIKNNMSSLASFLSIQNKLTDNIEAKDILLGAKSRVKSMGVLYDKLYRTENYKKLAMREYLSKLVDEISNIFPNIKDIEIIKDIEDFAIDAKFFFPLGIIINELITNSMKYAFNGRENNILSISCRLVNNRVILSINDNGKGLPNDVNEKKSTGFGLQLVNMLLQQIKGNMSINRSFGTEVIVEFDL